MSFDIYVNTTDGEKGIQDASPLVRVNVWQFPQTRWGGAVWEYHTLSGYVPGDMLMIDWGVWPGQWEINGSLPNIRVRDSNGTWEYIRFTAYRRIS